MLICKWSKLTLSIFFYLLCIFYMIMDIFFFFFFLLLVFLRNMTVIPLFCCWCYFIYLLYKHYPKYLVDVLKGGGLEVRGNPLILVIESLSMNGNSPDNFRFSSFTGAYVNINAIESYNTQSSQLCASSTTLCADAGLPGTTCTDRSTSLGVWCNASTAYPYISSISSSDCTNDSRLIWWA